MDDRETDLYYCQSRYYDPQIGRFINADAYASTGQGILGNNMFAYCGNSPVNYTDPSGRYFNTYQDGSGALELMNGIVDSGGGGGGGPSVGSSVNPGSHLQAIIDRERAYYNNTSEEVVLNSDTIAFYHGVPVFRADFGDGGGLSFGIIVIDDNYKYDEYGIRVLRHEYGHRLHMNDIGVIPYLFTTAIPSLIGAGLTNAGVLPQSLYYSQPWEYVADMYGRVDRGNYAPWADEAAAIFWLYTMAVGGVC